MLVASNTDQIPLGMGRPSENNLVSPKVSANCAGQSGRRRPRLTDDVITVASWLPNAAYDQEECVSGFVWSCWCLVVMVSEQHRCVEPILWGVHSLVRLFIHSFIHSVPLCNSCLAATWNSSEQGAQGLALVRLTSGLNTDGLQASKQDPKISLGL